MSAPGEQVSGSTTSTTPSDPGGATVKQVLDIQALPHFDPKGEPNSLSVQWKRWKRAFNLYVASNGVTNEDQKIALLLHSGGMELQEIYYTLVPEDNATTFNDCLAALDNYFTPKVNVPFERHVFRQMQQTEGETIDQFVCRLHQKAISCDFANVDEAIRDQIIEKCKDSGLRRKFLEKASDATLTVLQETARVHEAVNTQMQSMGGLERVNRISQKYHQRKEKERAAKKFGKEKKVLKERKCTRCGRTGHSERDRSCPALGKACNKCGLLGHFAACCRSKVERKRPSEKQRSDGANQISEEPEEDYYAFVVKCGGDLSGVADLCIGGVQLKNVLIDSGATCNIVDCDTWESLKQEGVKCRSQRCERKLLAYGQSEPIEVVGTVESEVYCEASGERSCSRVYRCGKSWQSFAWKGYGREIELAKSWPS